MTFSPEIGQLDMLVLAHSKEWVSLLTITLLAVFPYLLTSIPTEKEQNSQDKGGYIAKSHLGGGWIGIIILE